jgi:hypothetical protein
VREGFGHDDRALSPPGLATTGGFLSSETAEFPCIDKGLPAHLVVVLNVLDLALQIGASAASRHARFARRRQPRPKALRRRSSGEWPLLLRKLPECWQNQLNALRRLSRVTDVCPNPLLPFDTSRGPSFGLVAKGRSAPAR